MTYAPEKQNIVIFPIILLLNFVGLQTSLLSFYPQLKMSDGFFDYCRKNIGNSSRYLYHDLKEEKSIFSKEWNLCVPEDIMQLINEGGEPLV